MPITWKEESASAVSSLTTITASATATGFIDVAKASNDATSIMVYHIYPASTPGAVPDTQIRRLEKKLDKLATTVKAARPEHRSDVQRCREEYDQNLRAAKTKKARAHCLMTYMLCIANCFVSVK